MTLPAIVTVERRSEGGFCDPLSREEVWLKQGRLCSGSQEPRAKILAQRRKAGYAVAIPGMQPVFVIEGAVEADGKSWSDAVAGSRGHLSRARAELPRLRRCDPEARSGDIER